MKKLPEKLIILPDKWRVKVTSVEDYKEDALKKGYELNSSWIENKEGIEYWYYSERVYDFEHPNFVSLEKVDEYLEITFEQFKNYVLKQDNMKEKEIIGYKLKEDCKQYEEASKKIVTNISDYTVDIFEEDSRAYNKFKQAGVLDLWFEPVFCYKEEEFKVGDWVSFYSELNSEMMTSKIKSWTPHSYCILENGAEPFKHLLRKATPEEIKKATEVVFEAGTWVVITSYSKMLNSSNFHVGGIYKLRERFGTNYGNFRVEADDDGDENGYGMDVVNYFTNEKYKIGVRAATQEEIDKATEPKVTKLYFGSMLVTIREGDNYIRTIYGIITEQELEHVINYLENPPELCGYPLTIHNRSEDKVVHASSISEGYGKALQIGFGCKSGKLSELKEILKVIKKWKK